MRKIIELAKRQRRRANQRAMDDGGWHIERWADPESPMVLVLYFAEPFLNGTMRVHGFTEDDLAQVRAVKGELQDWVDALEYIASKPKQVDLMPIVLAGYFLHTQSYRIAKDYAAKLPGENALVQGLVLHYRHPGGHNNTLRPNPVTGEDINTPEQIKALVEFVIQRDLMMNPDNVPPGAVLRWQ